MPQGADNVESIEVEVRSETTIHFQRSGRKDPAIQVRWRAWKDPKRSTIITISKHGKNKDLYPLYQSAVDAFIARVG